MDGALEEEGSVCHLQLLQGMVNAVIMLIALETVNNHKTDIFKKNKENCIHIMVSKPKCFSSDNLWSMLCTSIKQ